MLLFSLAGVPPSLGFFAKWGVWNAALDADLIYLWLPVQSPVQLVPITILDCVFDVFWRDSDSLGINAPPVLNAVLMVSALAMVIGVVSLFGLEGAAEAAAVTLLR